MLLCCSFRGRLVRLVRRHVLFHLVYVLLVHLVQFVVFAVVVWPW